MLYETEKICNLITEEIGKIAERGLNNANIDTAYKLIDMYKDLKQAESCENSVYSQRISYEHGNSYESGTKRNRSDGYKQRLMDSVKDMMESAQTQEERDAMERYWHYIKEMA